MQQNPTTTFGVGFGCSDHRLQEGAPSMLNTKYVGMDILVVPSEDSRKLRLKILPRSHDGHGMLIVPVCSGLIHFKA